VRRPSPWSGRVGERSEPGWGGGAVDQRSSDNVHYAVGIRHDIVVPEPQNGEPAPPETLVASLIAPTTKLDIVLATVELDDEPRRDTSEIDDEFADRSLTAEVEPLRLHQSQRSPQFSLGVGLVSA